MKKLILLLFLFASISLYAQKGKLSGIIMDQQDSSIIKGATVSIYKKSDSSLTSTIVTDNFGRFMFVELINGAYFMKITSVGYQDKKFNFNLTDAENNMGMIFQDRLVKELSGITIVSTAPAVTQKDDTAQYNSNQYKVNPDATTEDLVKKMPGISIDKSGTITAHGEQVKKITVDGKDFFGDDANTALKNIPAAAVDKIQVYDKMSDQSQLTGIDDGNAQKSINIITKAGISNAQFGRIYAGIGNDQRYSAGGNTSFFKGERRISVVGNFNNINQQNFGSQDFLGLTGSNNKSNIPGGNRGPGAPVESFTIDQANGISSTNAIGINYGDKWSKSTTVTGSYFFNNSKNENLSFTNNYLIEGNQNTQRQSSAETLNSNHRINARIEIKLDTNNMLFIIPSLNFQKNTTDGFSIVKSFERINDSLFNSNANSIRKKEGYNLKNSLLFRHNFKNKNRIFTIGLNTTATKNDSYTTLNGEYRFYDLYGFPIYPDSLQQQLNSNNTNGFNVGSSITYNEPLGKKEKGQIQFEYNPTLQKNYSDQSTFQYDGQHFSTYDTSLSNIFNNSIITNNGGITYRYNRSKDEQMAININYQNTLLKNERTIPSITNIKYTFNNILPYAYWRKKISKYANIRMFYRAGTVIPTINQLQDVVNLTNPSNVSSGNKDLRQSYTQYMGSRFSYTNTKNNRSLFAGVFLQTSRDYISNATYITSIDSVIQKDIVLKKGTQFNKPVNLDGYRYFRTYCNFGIPVKPIKSTLNFNSLFLFQNLPGLINNTITTTQTFQYNLGVALVSNISEYVDYNISYNAGINNAKIKSTVITNNNYINHNFNVTLNMLSKKGWFIQNDLAAQIYTGLSGGLDRNFTIWNASIGKKFFKNNAGELKVSVYDLLNQNQSVYRTITNTYIEDAESKVLRRYFMLTFSYNLKNFGNAKKPATTDEFIPKVGYPTN